MITVDLPVLGIRERDVRSQYVLPDALLSPSMAAMGRRHGFSLLQIGELIDPSLTWGDVEDFAAGLIAAMSSGITYWARTSRSRIPRTGRSTVITIASYPWSAAWASNSRDKARSRKT